MKHTREKISPCRTPSSLDVNRIYWLSDAYDSCCCCKDRLYDASDFGADPGIRESTIEEELNGPFTLGGIPAGCRAARYFTAGCCVYIRR